MPVLFVHGVRTSRTMWRAQVEVLEQLGHRTLAVDLPGHGARTGERFTLTAAAATVHAGLRELAESGGGPVVVVGLSLGAYVALHAVASDATGVGAVVAAGCCTPPASAVLHGWALLARGIVATPDGGARLNQFMVDRTLSPQAAADIAAGGFALDVMDDVLREMAGADPLAELAAIEVPVWLVNGRYDHFRTRERAYARAGRDTRLRVVRGAKHLVSLDAPVRFTRVVLEAVAKVEARAAVQARGAVAPGRPVSRGAGSRHARRRPPPRSWAR